MRAIELKIAVTPVQLASPAAASASKHSITK